MRDADVTMIRSIPRRIGVGLIVFVFFLANVAVIVGPVSTIPVLPRVRALEHFLDLFLIFGIFSWYETTNQEMTVWGLTRGSATQPSYWRYLPAEDYFAGSRGERQSRIWASRHYRTLSREQHWQAWRFLGEKILERHNRNHPEDPIVRVAFQNEMWPRSIEGFHVRRGPSPERQYWIVAE